MEHAIDTVPLESSGTDLLSHPKFTGVLRRAMAHALREKRSTATDKKLHPTDRMVDIVGVARGPFSNTTNRSVDYTEGAVKVVFHVRCEDEAERTAIANAAGTDWHAGTEEKYGFWHVLHVVTPTHNTSSNDPI